MQAIRTRYHGPTNARGSYMSAHCEAGSIRVPYEYALNTDGNHEAACAALRGKLGWVAPAYPAMTAGVFEGDFYWVFKQGEAS